MSIYEVNNKPTVDKIEKFDENRNIFYRLQNKNYEMGTKSWGMIHDTEEEARYCYEEDGFECEDDAILDGKSACYTANELSNYLGSYSENNTVVLILDGRSVGEGHDGEDVVEVDSILEIWSYEDFCNMGW